MSTAPDVLLSAVMVVAARFAVIPVAASRSTVAAVTKPAPLMVPPAITVKSLPAVSTDALMSTSPSTLIRKEPSVGESGRVALVDTTTSKSMSFTTALSRIRQSSMSPGFSKTLLSTRSSLVPTPVAPPSLTPLQTPASASAAS